MSEVANGAAGLAGVAATRVCRLLQARYGGVSTQAHWLSPWIGSAHLLTVTVWRRVATAAPGGLQASVGAKALARAVLLALMGLVVAAGCTRQVQQELLRY
jgi:hypothetical protein